MGLTIVTRRKVLKERGHLRVEQEAERSARRGCDAKTDENFPSQRGTSQGDRKRTREGTSISKEEQSFCVWTESSNFLALEMVSWVISILYYKGEIEL